MKTNKNSWKIRIAILFAAMSLMVVSTASAITYTTTYANTADAPTYGTMILPCPYCNEFGGNTLDGLRVYMYDSQTTFQIMRWDMGASTNFVRVYPNIENGNGYNWDYMQWSLWGSNTGSENAGDWVLLYDPTSSSGTSVNDFQITAANGIVLPTTVYRYGSNSVGPDAYGDAFTMDFNLPASYRYIGIRASTIAWQSGGHNDPEIDAIATKTQTNDIPEFPTIAMPILGVIGLMFLFQRRKGN
jgi:hypothetical protein